MSRSAEEILADIFNGSPPIPYATGPYARGFVYMLNEDGSVDEKRCREYYASKAKYDAEFAEWAAYHQAIGEVLREETAKETDEPADK